MPLSLIFNANDRNQSGLLDSFLSKLGLSDEQSLVRGDKNLLLQLRPVIPSATVTRPWDDAQITGDTYQVAIGNPDTAPESGTFALSLDGDATGLTALPLSAASIATALSAADGGDFGTVQVTLIAPGVFRAAWASNGAVPALDASAANALVPDSTVTIVVDVAGSSTTKAVQYIVARQSPVAYAEPATALTAAAVTASITQAGDATHNKIYTIALTAGTYGGTFTVTVTSKDGTAEAVGLATGDMTSAELAELLAQHTRFGIKDIAVERDGDSFTVEFLGTQGLSNTPVIAVANVDLLAPKGVSGLINLNTISLYRAFWNSEALELDFTLAVKRIRTSGEEAEILHKAITLRRSIIDPNTMVPVMASSYLTVAAGDLRYAKKTIATGYRVKDTGAVQLWNADQSLFFTIGVSGASGAELLTVAATGEA